MISAFIEWKNLGPNYFILPSIDLLIPFAASTFLVVFMSPLSFSFFKAHP